jgi:hypothetical protein
MMRDTTKEQRDKWICWRFNVTHEDQRRWGGCSYYGDSYPDGALNWTGPQPRPGTTLIYCDCHWEQVQQEEHFVRP